MLASAHAAGRTRAIATTTDVSETSSLAVDLAPGHPRGLRLHAPVLTASGTFGFGDEYRDVLNLAALGAIVTKTVTPEPRQGNRTPRTIETPAGMLNSIGLPNPGGAGAVREKAPIWADLPCPVVVSIAAHDRESWTTLAARFDGLPNVVAIEANLSCPNVAGGLDYSTDPTTTAATVKAVRRGVSLPVIAKLSPNVTDLRPIARAAEDAGADAVSLINTLLGMVIDTDAALPFLGAGVGGLSGPAIRPLAVRCVYDVAGAVSIPIIGMGGVMTTDDALQFLMAGASAVQVGTATFREPRTAERIVDGLSAYLESRGFASVSDVVGLARPEPLSG
ncbi:MAG: dihydroorotate dehydrogenase [Chloroflexi bacterium]|nr:dihydroorotate dehydrogenase [Chloroflexota bacterium]